MRICLLADAGSVHTRRWAAAMAERGNTISVLSLRPGDVAGVNVVDLSPPPSLGKLGYLTVRNGVRRLLRDIRPDVLHAHYATSYGLLGALAGFRPYMVSAWGADVFDFPRRSPLHAALLRFNLRRADVVACTSLFMRGQVERYARRAVEVTPFGVDTAQFSPARDGTEKPGRGVTIGLVKALEEKYGVPVLVRAFEILAERHSDVRLMVVGDGSQRTAIEAAVERSPAASRIQLLPAVPHSRVPALLRTMDVFVVPSIAESESFGVAAIEASACQLPVVASRLGGLAEVVIDGETGILVSPNDPVALAAGIEPLLESADLRRRLGLNGRAHVERAYGWNESVNLMERLYRRLVEGRTPAVATP
jgi:L-malate glycosyltransferase